MNETEKTTAKTPCYMYRFAFTKTGSICFVGHLDILTTFRRAFKRAKLPVRYTTGFNPHMDISIAMPLPLGMDGLCEYCEIVLTEERNADEISEELNNVLPSGINIISAVEIPEKSKSAAALIYRAEYEVKIDCPFDIIQKETKEFLQKKEVKIMKKTKSGITETDIRPDVFCLEVSESNGKAVVTMVISAGSERNVKPEHIIKCLLTEGNKSYITYSRKKLFLISDK